VTIPHSLVIGIVAAVISNFGVIWRTKKGIDDTLDGSPCHGVGGMVGMLLTAVFAHSNVNSAVETNGLLFGETGLFVAHLIALIEASAFACHGSLLLLIVTDLLASLRVSEEAENMGLDLSQHDEEL